MVGLGVALVRHCYSRGNRQRVVPVVPLLALGGNRVEAGVDAMQGVDVHRLGCGNQERLRRCHLELDVTWQPVDALPRNRVRHQCVGHVGIHHDLVCVDHRQHGVEVHGGSLLRDRHRQHRVRQVGGEHPTGETLGSSRRGSFADSNGQHSWGQQQHVATFDMLQFPAIAVLRADKTRMVPVDEVGQMGLAFARRHRQTRHGHLLADPDTGVPGEQQVGQWRDQKVVMRQQTGNQPVPAAYLVVADTCGQGSRQLLRVQAVEVAVEIRPHCVA
jgi:hypothetical protein